MPVYCIAFGYDNDQRNAPQRVGFHRLPLKKSSMLKQVRIFLVGGNCKLHYMHFMLNSG